MHKMSIDKCSTEMHTVEISRGCSDREMRGTQAYSNIRTRVYLHTGMTTHCMHMQNSIMSVIQGLLSKELPHWHQ